MLKITEVKFNFRKFDASVFGKIGGKNVIVEVDESKFGKRKFNRRHHVEGVWVIGLVERTEKRKIILISVKKRDSATINEIILKYVMPGSIVYTDGWRGYNSLKTLGFEHFVVDHSVSFVDYETKVHTNTIEGCWSAVKKQVPIRCRVEKKIDFY